MDAKDAAMEELRKELEETKMKQAAVEEWAYNVHIYKPFGVGCIFRLPVSF